jgi:hypothetical protein
VSLQVDCFDGGSSVTVGGGGVIVDLIFVVYGALFSATIEFVRYIGSVDRTALLPLVGGFVLVMVAGVTKWWKDRE